MPRVPRCEVLAEVTDDRELRLEILDNDNDLSDWYDDWMSMQIELEEEEARSDEGSFFDDLNSDREEETGDIYNPFMEAELERQRAEQDKEAWLSGRDL